MDAVVEVENDNIRIVPRMRIPAISNEVMNY